MRVKKYGIGLFLPLLLMPCIVFAELPTISGQQEKEKREKGEKRKAPDSSSSSGSSVRKKEKEYCSDYFNSALDKHIITAQKHEAEGNCYYAIDYYKRVVYNANSPRSECKEDAVWYRLVLDRLKYAQDKIDELSPTCAAAGGKGQIVIQKEDGAIRLSMPKKK